MKLKGIHFFIPAAYLFFFVLISSDGFAQYDFSEVDQKLHKNRRALGYNIATLIYKDGEIIYRRNFGNLNAGSVVPIASCSKWLSAALIMTFVDEGKISLEDSIGKWLPIFTQYGKGGIKIRHCLSHTTGLDSKGLTFFGIMHEYSRILRMNSLEEEVNDFAKNRAQIAEPGTEFRYSNIGLNILGHILEVISGKTFEALFRERIAIPLDMDKTSFARGRGPVDPSGGAVSSAREYMNFLSMILNKGIYHGRRILKEESVEAMQRPAINLSQVKYAPKPAEGFLYAFGEWVQETDSQGAAKTVASPGLFGSWPLVDNCHQYACIFVIRSLLNERQKNIYLDVKTSIDKLMIDHCR